MREQTIHRLYTEQKNTRVITKLLNEQFDSFTLQGVTGYYKGNSEKSIVVEIVGAKPSSIRKVAERIKKMNGQKSILTIIPRTIRGDPLVTEKGWKLADLPRKKAAEVTVPAKRDRLRPLLRLFC
jgi:hypothetical protein